MKGIMLMFIHVSIDNFLKNIYTCKAWFDSVGQ